MGVQEFCAPIVNVKKIASLYGAVEAAARHVVESALSTTKRAGGNGLKQ
jgi:hypothetical protein